MKPTLTLLAAGALALAACSKHEPEPGEATENAAAAATATVASTLTTPPPGAAAPATPTPPAPPAAPKEAGPLASVLHPALLDPSKAKEKAPDLYKAKFTTSKGDFVVEVHRDWAPNGADRFYNLVKVGFFDDTRCFRAIEGFMVQFGISGDPAVNAKWQEMGIPDDPIKQSNKRGYVTFAQRPTPNSRSTQVFVNYSDSNSRLDNSFAPFGRVVQGMDVVDGFYKGYGESPNQGLIQAQGNTYLDAQFPKLDAIKHAEIVK
ncbi:MAG TPA: peptidylprolyl isomerase [Polyangiaceae bacterium]|nr:peptidylprolyl isomerase [Polyangiaceae bacterium]